ncbi:MAG: hypothetical protein II999_02630 [Bacteroidaceae bacterium]|nr:hypothetical protein [Bacteroidaceae bacterium]
MDTISAFIEEHATTIGLIIGIVLNQGISYREKRKFQKDTAMATYVWKVEQTKIKTLIPILLFLVFLGFAGLFAFSPMSTTKVQAGVSITITVAFFMLAVYLYQFFKQPDSLVFADDNLILYKGIRTKKYRLDSLTRIETEKRKNTVVTLYNSSGKQVVKLCTDDYEYPDKLLEHLRAIPLSQRGGR